MPETSTPGQTYSCDHRVTFSVETADVVEVVRGSGFVDEIRIPRVIQDVTHIVQTSHEHQPCLYPMEDTTWRYATPNRVEWVDPVIEPGDTYRVSYTYRKEQIHTYSPYNCPRCGGNEWYTGILDDRGMLSVTRKGIEKLGELVLHVLLTRKGTHFLFPRYGTYLSTLPGQVFGSARSLEKSVRECVLDAEEQIRAHVNAELVSGRDVPLSEQLDRLVILKVELLEDNMSGSVDLQVISKAGDALQLTAGAGSSKTTPKRVG